MGRPTGRKLLAATAAALALAPTSTVAVCTMVGVAIIDMSDYWMCLRRECDDNVMCHTITEQQCDDPFPIPAAVLAVAPWMDVRWEDFGHLTGWQACPKMCKRCDVPEALPPPSPCPAGWNYTEGGCFSFPEPPALKSVTWQEAAASCAALGASLAVLDTPAKNHLALELLVERRRVRGAAAWIGLHSTVGSCTLDRTGWAWVPTGARPEFVSWWRTFNASTDSWRSWPCSSGANVTHCGLLGFPMDSYAWWDAPCDQALARGYMCQRPATFREVDSGRCQDVGLLPIDSLVGCEQASAALGFTAGPAFLVRKYSAAIVYPEGCWFAEDGGGHLHFTIGNDSHGVGVLPVEPPHKMRVLCHNPANASTNKTPVVGPEVGPNPDPSNDRKEVRWDLAVTIPACSVAYLALAVVVCLSRTEIGGVAARILDFARRSVAGLGRLPAGGCDLSCSAGGHDASLRHCVVQALHQKRNKFATLVTFVLAVLDLVDITNTVAGDLAACGRDHGSSSNLAMLLVLAARVCAMCIFLAYQLRCNARCAATVGTRHVELVVLTVLGLRVAQVVVLAEQELLADSRVAYELLWRLLLGVCMHPSRVCAFYVAYSLSLFGVYTTRIPDHMVAVTKSTRSYALFGRACINLWSAQDIETTISRIKSLVYLDQMYPNLGFSRLLPVLEDLLGQTSSLTSFVGTEIAILIVVMVCLGLLHSLLEEEAASALRLRGSESLLSAFSDILAKLCDAVVNVDGELVISRPAPKLAALLGCQRTQQGLEGHNLREYLIDEDHESLHGPLVGEVVKDCHLRGETLSLTFKDAFGVRVPCQIFHAAFSLADGSPSFVLGVNEIGERDAPQQALLAPHVAEAIGVQRDLPAGAVAEIAPPAAPAPDLPDSGGETSDTALSARTCDQVVRQVDFTYHDRLIVGTSFGMGHLLGDDPRGRKLADFLLEPQGFNAWLDSQVGIINQGVHIKQYGPTVLKLRPCMGSSNEQPRIYEASFDVLFPMHHGDATEYVLSLKMKGLRRLRVSECRRLNLPIEVRDRQGGPSRAPSSGTTTPRSRKRGRAAAAAAAAAGGTPTGTAAAAADQSPAASLSSAVVDPRACVSL